MYVPAPRAQASNASLILWPYVFASSVVLVNLLVAMFADTYARIKARSEIEFKFQKYGRIFMYLNLYTELPPPFNLPHLLAKLLCGAVSGLPDTVCSNESTSSQQHGYQERYLNLQKETAANDLQVIAMELRKEIRILSASAVEQEERIQAVSAKVGEQI